MRQKLCKADEGTTWFGVDRSDAGPPTFQDFGRFGDLMDHTNEEGQGTWQPPGHLSPLEVTNRTPSIASFVGQTGAGKSALIKLLIDLGLGEDEEYSTPVVGSTDSADVADPTSEDVHLYSEPRTAYSAEPILFADCEGLEGGEREPINTKLRRKRRGNRLSNTEASVRQSRAARLLSERRLAWADTTKINSREYAVTNLYPRILYTFSDVIVFVLRNPKVIEGVFSKLVEWADAALETSSNQPVLPHALIVLNASRSSFDVDWWDVEAGTQKIFESLSKTVYNNPTFTKYAAKWQSCGREIKTVEQLMEVYYSSVRIIRVPDGGRPKVVQQQVDKLYNQIQRACQMSIWRKRELRMLLDADNLQSYLQHAFTHFACTLDAPFDFVQASFLNSPIPLDFGGNILKLAINIMDEWKDNADANTIFEELSYMVASCIMFDCARKKIVGTPDKIFPQYLEHLDTALENFSQSHWPCEFSKQGGGRCVNVRGGHSKGHQRQDGQVLAFGEYDSQFSFETHHGSFRSNVYLCLQNLHGSLQERIQKGQREIIAASEIHRDVVMPNFYRHATRGQRIFSSQTACYCCLFEPPEHVLPCGHILCTSCIRNYGRPCGNTEVEIQECPIESGSLRRYQSWKFRVYLKPRSAGIRVLTLDGGGIRGVVELEILQLIEEAMGGYLPIRNFFDLIVGTSTGGLIALGLGIQHLSVADCTDSFQRLCPQAFTPRIGSGLPVIGWFIENYNGSKYETKPFEQALQASFSKDQNLFGGPQYNESSGCSIKVAVTSTSEASGLPVIFSNYNRPCYEHLPYQFQRPERAGNELKLWEVARATTAATGYFKPFHHEASKRTYLDGAICHNNPIAVAEKERRLIWSNLVELSPDLVLSIGTGISRQPRNIDNQSTSAPPLGVYTNLKAKIKIVKNHIASSLDCERTWNDFQCRLGNSRLSRYMRLNPKLSMEIPKLDDVQSVLELRRVVRDKMSQDSRIEEIANRLISSCFYFELTEPQSDHSAGCIFSGRIACRLAHGTKEIGQLGRILMYRLKSGRDLCFIIQEERQTSEICQKIPISKGTIDSMIRLNQFNLGGVDIELANKLVSTEIKLCMDNDCFPISGFPRRLTEDENLQLNSRQNFADTNKRRLADAASPRRRRLQWEPPNTTHISQVWNLDSFTKPSHVLGHASARDIERMKTYLTQGPAPATTPNDGMRIGNVFRNIGRNRRKSEHHHFAQPFLRTSYPPGAVELEAIQHRQWHESLREYYAAGKVSSPAMASVHLQNEDQAILELPNEPAHCNSPHRSTTPYFPSELDASEAGTSDILGSPAPSTELEGSMPLWL
ncbi:hypothetical protein EV356DRAFT_536374 [Viridothelium virens]|uniref:FabD/lysophospholipase-like protein n=1 Tax=Viridothelium virens TaxID=1048519 RepID=A0A6A6GXW8_VIRVR|nr:hypothetical protein EV356DRAFT_536374 [Viridothelium virens]